MSGAAIWRLACAEGDFCLRRWPREHPTTERLQLIHSIQQYWHNAGLDVIPRLVASSANTTFVAQDGYLWEISTWQPGVADFHDRPSRDRLQSAMQTIARLHRASESLEKFVSIDRIRGVSERIDLLKNLPQSLNSIPSKIDARFGERLRQLAIQSVHLVASLQESCLNSLTEFRAVRLLLAPCLRDIWHDHVLFEGDEVSGVIDFGAVRVDSPLLDLSRLLGSLIEDDNELWEFGLNVYSDVRNLTQSDRQLIRAVDYANTLLSSANWIRWLFVDERHFEDMEAVESRLALLMERLQRRLPGRSI